MKTHLVRVGLLTGLVSGPALLHAQNLDYFNSFVAFFQDYVLRPLLALFIALSVVLFLWGMVVFMANTDSEQARTAGKDKMIWGVVILFVMLSIWGLVNILQEVTGVEDATMTAPPLPR